MPIELKPCPFCGNSKSISLHECIMDYFSIGYRVICCGCGAETRIFKSKEKTAEAWNRRADDAEEA